MEEFRYKVSHKDRESEFHTARELNVAFFDIAIASHHDPEHNHSYRHIIPGAEQSILVNSPGYDDGDPNPSPNPKDGIYIDIRATGRFSEPPNTREFHRDLRAILEEFNAEYVSKLR